MVHYYLDTSVAGLILDGELFSRAPEKITFMPELKCTSTKADLEAHPGAERIKLAYKWNRDFLGGGGRLIITPTARVELMSAPQVSYKSLLFCICMRLQGQLHFNNTCPISSITV